jgi:hypothetical protein
MPLEEMRSRCRGGEASSEQLQASISGRLRLDNPTNFDGATKGGAAAEARNEGEDAQQGDAHRSGSILIRLKGQRLLPVLDCWIPRSSG